LAACAASTPGDDERREFRILETRLADLASAPPDDRSIRLDELAAARIETPRIKEIQGLCVTAYRSFFNSAELFGRAKEKTLKVEAAVAEAEAAKELGKALDPQQERELYAMKDAAEGAVQAANKSLDESEKLASDCQRRCDAFRARLNH